MNINTKEYWNERFGTKHWDRYNGLNQTKDFMKSIIDNLPQYMKKVLNSNNITIADVGCGIATGSEVLKNNFSKAKVTGIDFSDAAISRNKEMYQDIDFQLELNKNYDVCINSNVLEHVDNPLQYLKDILNKTNKYAIILIPYKEQLGDIDEHIHSFDDDSFPKKINGFELAFSKVIKTKFWMWEQLLMVYKKEK